MLQFPLPMDSSRWKPNIELSPNCPRCASSNTKFCYYNNYSFSQPRYFCKACRRYWTKGGSLRNVPVGGGCRKNRRARHLQRGSLSINCTHTFSGSEDTQLVADKPSEANGSDIDMALVFAKFLNQNHNSDQEFDTEANASSSSNLSSSLTLENVETENKESHQASDHALLGGLPQEGSIENFVGEELSGIELEGLLGGDEVVQDVFWSDATTSSSLTWELQMMELQKELEYSMAMPFDEDGPLPTTCTTNLISDGWSWNCFDVSTLERDPSHQLN